MALRYRTAATIHSTATYPSSPACRHLTGPPQVWPKLVRQSLDPVSLPPLLDKSLLFFALLLEQKYAPDLHIHRIAQIPFPPPPPPPLTHDSYVPLGITLHHLKKPVPSSLSFYFFRCTFCFSCTIQYTVSLCLTSLVLNCIQTFTHRRNAISQAKIQPLGAPRPLQTSTYHWSIHSASEDSNRSAAGRSPSKQVQPPHSHTHKTPHLGAGILHLPLRPARNRRRIPMLQ